MPQSSTRPQGPGARPAALPTLCGLDHGSCCCAGGLPGSAPWLPGCRRSAAAHAAAHAAAAASSSRSSRLAPYHPQVVDHYEKPRNVGSLDKSDPSVGTGLVGAPACGDVMKLQVRRRGSRGGGDMGGQQQQGRSSEVAEAGSCAAPCGAREPIAGDRPTDRPTSPTVPMPQRRRRRSAWTTTATSWRACSRRLAAAPPSPPPRSPPSGALRCCSVAARVLSLAACCCSLLVLRCRRAPPCTSSRSILPPPLALPCRAAPPHDPLACLPAAGSRARAWMR